MDHLDLLDRVDLEGISDQKEIPDLLDLQERKEIDWPSSVRKETRAIEDCVALLDHPDPTVESKEPLQLSMCLVLRATEDSLETKETKDSVYHIYTGSKVKLVPQGQEENLAKMENPG